MSWPYRLSKAMRAVGKERRPALLENRKEQ
jgi:hypothetical protein